MKHYYEILYNLPVHLLEDSYEYISRSDSAHNEEHVRAVVTEADNISLKEGGDYKKNILIAALLHDVGCSVRDGREKHEVYSAHIAMGLLYEYSYCGTSYIIEAILEHRGSFTGVRSSPLSDILAAADRGRPSASVLFLRAYLFTKEVNDVDHDTAVLHAIDYNRAKFGYDGYARMQDNTLLMKYYPKECVAIERVFEEATVELVEEHLEKFAWKVSSAGL